MNKILSIISLCAIAICANAQNYPVRHTDDSEIGLNIQKLYYETAKKTINAQLTTAKRKKQSTTLLDRQLKECERGLNALKGTDKIAVIDSVIVDKSSFLSAYKISDDLGKVALSQNGELASFTPERGFFTYRTELAKGDSILRIKKYFIENGKTTTVSALKGINFEADTNYPFLMTDGITFYFASRSKEGLGNYDIYVTRYDSEEDRYLQPTNLGFPFNSYANDYMMVVDEQNGIGWFASDRYQPENKVCVYTFIYSESRNTYDWETDEHSQIYCVARLGDIRKTWGNASEQTIRTARQNLMRLSNNVKSDAAHDFTFVINDLYTYHSASDFKKMAAYNEFKNYSDLMKKKTDVEEKLEDLRQRYHNSSASSQQSLRQSILDLESQLTTLRKSINNSAKLVRQLELK